MSQNLIGLTIRSFLLLNNENILKKKVKTKILTLTNEVNGIKNTIPNSPYQINRFLFTTSTVRLATVTGLYY